MPWWVSPWVGLSALIVGILLSIRPVFLFLIEVARTQPGLLGAVIAAGIGFAGVILTTRQGFRNLILSQQDQARREREARDHQRAISEEQRSRQASDDLRALASALLGELGAAVVSVEKMRKWAALQQALYAAMGETRVSVPVNLSNSFPQFDALVFKANIKELGKLGPSTCGDVVDVYQLLRIRDQQPPVEGVTGEHVAIVMKGFKEGFDEWILDAMHVQKRLLAAMDSRDDPGSLYDERRRREAERVQ